MLDSSLETALARIRPLTMVARESLLELAWQVRAVLALGIPGSIVECGVWCGGASFLMAELLRAAGADERKVWLFDSFEGMPKPDQIDGPAAAAWLAKKDKPWYSHQVPFTFEEVQKNAARLGLADRTMIVKGWFDKTLATHRASIGPIALLRIDADWHSSVTCCLETLYDQVVDGGFIILDDYYAYDGCAVATHEFLGKRRLAHRIESGTTGSANPEFCQFACFRKGPETWQWAKSALMLAQDLRQLPCSAKCVILVDDNQLRHTFGTDVAPLPFLEHEGQYWGSPADDDTAIRELQRLQAGGAQYIAFAWPAFWWLDHYQGFARHLRERCPCVLESDRLRVFALESHKE